MMLCGSLIRHIRESSPQDTHSATRSSYAGNARGLRCLEFVVILVQNGLMHDQSGHCIHRGPAQIHIADFDYPFAFTFALAGARVIASTDQTATTKDLRGVVIVGRIADSCCQTGDLNITEFFELGPDMIRRFGTFLA